MADDKKKKPSKNTRAHTFGLDTEDPRDPLNRKPPVKVKVEKLGPSKIAGNPHMTTWVKGQSGNPAGSKKGKVTTRSILKKFLKMKASNALLGLDDDNKIIKALNETYGFNMTMRDMMCLSQIKKAIVANDTQAFNAIIDRIDGKPVQTNLNENTSVSYEDFLKRLESEGE